MTTTTRRRTGRVALVLSAAALAAGLMVAPAHAAGDVKGPGCRDIADGGGDWVGASGTLNFGFILSKSACKNVTYTLHAVLDQGGSPTGPVYSTTTYTVDSSGQLVFTLSVPDPDPDPSTAPCTIIDVYGTTSSKGKVFDRAPDTGYAQFYDNADVCGSPSRDFH